MKITPLELRQFEFEKTFRGYSTDEVDMLINNLAQEWERVLMETKMMRMQLELAEKEAAKLREIEMTLFKTLKTAEDTSTMITEQANQQAAKHLAEASQKAERQLAEAETRAENKIAEADFESEKQLADAKSEANRLVTDARDRANEIIRQAEDKAKYVNEEVLNDVKNIERDFDILRHYKDNLLAEMRGLANATIQHVERFEDKFDENSIKNKIDKANDILSPDKEITDENISDDPVNENSVKTEEDSNAEVKTVFEKSLHENNEEISLSEKEPGEATEQQSASEKARSQENVEEIKERPVSVDDSIADDETVLVENYEDEEFYNLNNDVEEEISETAAEVADRVEALEVNVEQKLIESYKDDDIEFNINAPDVVKETESAVDARSIAFLKDRLRQTNAPKEASESIEEAKSSPSTADNDRMELVDYGDDLTRIEGIGPKVRDLLKDAGIKSFRDLATTPLYRVKEHLNNAGSHFNMVDASTWTEQALLAAEGRWEELEARQVELIGGRESVVEQIAAVPEPVNTVRNYNPPSPILDVPRRNFADAEVATPTVAKPVNNLENITEEMLEKVNKVKSAIRKAMSEKNDKPEGEKDGGNLPTLDDVMKRNRNKGGSFFDNID